MFWDKWIPAKYLIKNEIAALEINISDDAVTYYLTHLKTKSNKLELEGTHQLKSLDEIPAKILKNKIPFVLVVNGKGILFKKVTLAEAGATPEQIIQANLPAVSASDFYIQLVEQENGTGFLSLCRKEIINNYLDNLKFKKAEVAQVLIGIPSLLGLQALLGNFNQLKLPNYAVELTNGLVENITPESNEPAVLKLEDTQIYSNFVLSFASGFHYFTKSLQATYSNPELEEITKKHIQNNRLKFCTIAFVAIAFVIAVTNVLFYTTYFDQNNRLETELGVYQGKYEQINQLLNEYQKKKDLIENAGILGKNKLSEFADKIALTIPEEVVLTEMNFHPPIEREEGVDSLLTFESNKIILRGNCNKSLIINEWVNVLNLQTFIKEVVLQKFAYNNEGILPNFEIRIETK